MPDTEREIYRAIGQLEATCDHLTVTSNTLAEMVQDLEKRLRKQEVKAATIGAIAGTVFAVITSSLKSIVTGGNGA